MNETSRLLIIDDDVDVLAAFVAMLSHLFQVATACSAATALDAIDKFAPDVVLCDIHMPGMTGIELLSVIKARNPELPVIMLTGNSTKRDMMAAVHHHAFDFLEKPTELPLLADALGRAMLHRRKQLRLVALQRDLDDAKREIETKVKDLAQLYTSSDFDGVPADPLPPAFGDVITLNPLLRARLQYAAAIAGTNLPVLLTGETGTGKDVLARALHAASGRRGELVAANVAGLDDALFADTLFGHVSGAFTSADRRRPGLIESAHGGTLFLDEIGDLSQASQVKLLRLLESGEYYPLGSDAVKKTDCRIVAATHRDIEVMAARGQFRSDLFFRLKAHHVQIPPLRERPEDLPLLLAHFVGQAAAEIGRAVPVLPKELTVLLGTYHFPGNVRELKSMVYDAVSRNNAGILSLAPFRENLLGGKSLEAPRLADVHTLGSASRALPTLKEAEDQLVAEALRRAEGNQGIAAGLLGLSRQALNKRLSRGLLKKTS